MSNYPIGTWAGDPQAPWNAPDPAPAYEHAIRQVTGDDADLTVETYGEWVASIDDKPQPLHTIGAIRGPISNLALLSLTMRHTADDAVLAHAAREIRARYLADHYTGRVIAYRMDEYMAEVA